MTILLYRVKRTPPPPTPREAFAAILGYMAHESTRRQAPVISEALIVIARAVAPELVELVCKNHLRADCAACLGGVPFGDEPEEAS